MISKIPNGVWSIEYGNKIIEGFRGNQNALEISAYSVYMLQDGYTYIPTLV